VVGGWEQKDLNTVSGKEGNTRGREKEKGAAPQDALSTAPIKAEHITIVFQTQTLRTQPYHKAEKQTELSTMATSTCLITSQESFQQENWKLVSQKPFP